MKQIKRGIIVTWTSCNIIWYGKIVLISGEFIEVEVLNRTGLRQWIKKSEILDIIGES